VIELWVPWVLATGNVGSAYLSGKRNKWGWALLVFTQLLFVAYAIITGQYGFLLQNVVMATIGVVNYVKWMREDKATAVGRMD
jgi:hypothetical protein